MRLDLQVDLVTKALSDLPAWWDLPDLTDPLVNPDLKVLLARKVLPVSLDVPVTRDPLVLLDLLDLPDLLACLLVHSRSSAAGHRLT